MNVLSRVGKAVAGVAACAAMLAGGVSVASASVPQADSIPDPARDGSASLTVHKYEVSDGYGDEATGLPLKPEDEPSQPLAGATFTIYQVPVGSLATNAGWLAAAQLQDQVGSSPSLGALEAAIGEPLGKPVSQVTGDDGIASFKGLDFGLYYVVESEAPEGYFPVAPFLVTVPTTDPNALDSWVYDVHIYPKDRPGPQKEVLDGESATPGEAVTWRISTSIPAGKVNGLTVRDTLAPQLLYTDVAQVALADYSSGSAEVTHTFTRNTDYDVRVSKTSAGLEHVEVVFSPAGLKYLDDVNDSAMRVIVDLETECLEAGLWENQAHVCDTPPVRARSAAAGEVCLATNTVVTRWGQLKVIKTDAEDETKTLEGAEFKLYYSHTNDFEQAVASGAVGTTGPDGEVIFKPLRYSDFAFGESLSEDDPSYWYYWLVETKAPTGYVLPTSPIPFQITVQDTDATGSMTMVVKNVANPGGVVPKPGGQTPEPGGTSGTGTTVGGLPVTGATIGGVLLLAAAALLLGVLARRRRKDEAADA